MVMEYVTSYVQEPRTAPLCGNSIATDRGFLARDMPRLDAYLHYRMIDVSSIKELCRRWYPRVYFGQPAEGAGPPGAGRHPGEHPGAGVLPADGFRAPARAGRGAAQGDRRASCDAGRDRLAGGRSNPVDAGGAGRGYHGRRAPPDGPARAHGGCSSAGRAPGCGPGCRGFKSLQSPHVVDLLGPVSNRHAIAAGYRGPDPSWRDSRGGLPSRRLDAPGRTPAVGQRAALDVFLPVRFQSVQPLPCSQLASVPFTVTGSPSWSGRTGTRRSRGRG